MELNPKKSVDKVAWIYTRNGRVLSTRSRGKDVYYLPGGKREAGESDDACLLREIREELAVHLKAETFRPLGTFSAQSHGARAGVMIDMACYAAEYEGELKASAEIAEFAWGSPIQTATSVRPLISSSLIGYRIGVN